MPGAVGLAITARQQRFQLCEVVHQNMLQAARVHTWHECTSETASATNVVVHALAASSQRYSGRRDLNRWRGRWSWVDGALDDGAIFVGSAG